MQKYEDLAQEWKLMVEKLQREEREMKARKNKKRKGGLFGFGLGILWNNSFDIWFDGPLKRVMILMFWFDNNGEFVNVLIFIFLYFFFVS